MAFIPVVPVIDVGRFIKWGKEAVVGTFKWLLIRAFVMSLMAFVVPLAIYKGWQLVQSKIFDFMMNNLDSSQGQFDGAVLELTGLTAWLSEQLRFAESFSLYMSALLISFTLRVMRVK